MTKFLHEEEKKMKGFIPVFSEAFSDAAEIVYIKSKDAKKWKNSNFYKMCTTARKSIFEKSSSFAYNVKWKKNTFDAEKYEIKITLRDGRKVLLAWNNWKVKISLSSKSGKSIEQRSA